MKLTPQEKEKRKIERALIRDEKEKQSEDNKVIKKKLKRCGIYPAYNDLYTKEQIRFKWLYHHPNDGSFLDLLHLSEEFGTEDIDIQLQHNQNYWEEGCTAEVFVTIKNYKI